MSNQVIKKIKAKPILKAYMRLRNGKLLKVATTAENISFKEFKDRLAALGQPVDVVARVIGVMAPNPRNF